jgi:pimeloyl-ACP methyl ester carboxylesterase
MTSRTGQQIEISLIRLPAESPGKRIGSLFLNPGGPGGPGVEFVREIATSLPAQLREHFDIVGFDPRGIITSTPLHCFDTLDEAFASYAPFAFPITAQEKVAWRAADKVLADACTQRGGPIADHMSTANAARDMDRLRAAVGDSKLTYLGFSYGSYLGVTYANLFPDRVRALVVDGVLDPVAWSTGRGGQAHKKPFSTRVRSDEGAQRTLEEFFRLCDAAGPQSCGLAGDSAARYAALAERLRAEPVEIVDDEGPFTFGYADLVSGTLGALYDPVAWPEAAAFLADVEAQATPVQLGKRLALVRSALGLGADAPAEDDYLNFVEGGPGVFCSDTDNPSTFDAWSRAAAAADRKFGYFGRPWTWLSSVCQQWTGADQDRYMGPFTTRTANPVLVVGNYFDPATRYQGAVTVSHLLRNSRLLSYAGWGHTVSYQKGNACIDDAVTRYLASTRLPAAGTVCAPNGNPFESTPPGVARSADPSAGAIVRSVLPDSVRRAMHG